MRIGVVEESRGVGGESRGYEGRVEVWRGE